MYKRQIGTLIYSVMVAVVTTIVCLLIAYPVAYLLAKGEFRRGNVLLMLFVMPMWINFTLRITALKEILTLIEGNLAFHPFLNTVIGMTYDFLPFMILPIYNTIAKIDHSYIEAAKDLGAKSYRVFLQMCIRDRINAASFGNNPHRIKKLAPVARANGLRFLS